MRHVPETVAVSGLAERSRVQGKVVEVLKRQQVVVEDVDGAEEEEDIQKTKKMVEEMDGGSGGDQDMEDTTSGGDQDMEDTTRPLEECAAVVARRTEVPARSSVTIALVLEVQQHRKGDGRRERARQRGRLEMLPPRGKLVFDANERMSGSPGSEARRSRDISDQEYANMAGLEVMGGGYYLDAKSGDTQEGLALAMLWTKGEAMYIRVENKTHVPMSLPRGMELGVFKLWDTQECEEDGLEICSVAMGKFTSTERGDESAGLEVADVEVEPTSATRRSEDDFDELAKTLGTLEPAERIKRLETFVTERWEAACGTPGVGFDNPELEDLLQLPDLLQGVRPTGWRMPGRKPNTKCGTSIPQETADILAMEADELYDDYVKLKKSYVRKSFELGQKEELEWKRKLERQTEAQPESRKDSEEAPSKRQTPEPYQESKFAEAFHQALAAVEAHFAPDNPWGVQPDDEEEFESIMRKPIEEADVSEDERKELERLCRKYYDVFRLGACLQPVKGFEYDLELINPNTKPIFVRPRRINPSLLAKTHEHFDALVEKGVCEPADSPWAFALVVAPKRSAETGQFTDCRFCINFCPLNRLIKETSYNYQLIDTVLDDVHASNYVTALD